MERFQPEKIHRIILKVSGEFLAGTKGFGYCTDTITQLVDDIVGLKRLGISIAIIIGGGNMCRGAELSATGLNRVTADNVGMLATVQNALVVADALKRRNILAEVFSAIQMDKICPFYAPEKAIDALESGKVCFLCGGTSNPFFTTDTAAVLRAVELQAHLVLKGTKVDGVYTADPVKDKSATFISTITYDEVLAKQLNVMDMTAFSLARDYNIPLKVFNITVKGNLEKAVLHNVGTFIHA